MSDRRNPDNGGSRADDARDFAFESYVKRGWNYRMTDIQAALPVRQLAALAQRPRLAGRMGMGQHRGRVSKCLASQITAVAA